MRNVSKLSLDNCLEWINKHIKDGMLNDDDKINFLAFKNILESGSCTNHGGRYLIVRKGKVFADTFDSPQDTFSLDIEFELDDDCVIFQIPENI
jgi:hypothetical protein